MRGLLIGAFLLSLTSPAKAHDDYWSKGKTDPVTGSLCCSSGGPRPDDVVLSQDQVVAVKGGFFLKDTGEFVPDERVQPSPDYQVHAFRWGCHKNGETIDCTKCFFYPFAY